MKKVVILALLAVVGITANAALDLPGTRVEINGTNLLDIESREITVMVGQTVKIDFVAVEPSGYNLLFDFYKEIQKRLQPFSAG